MTWTTLPLFVFGSAAGFLGAALVRVAISPRTALSAIGLQLAFQRLRPAHDLCDLLGDLRLPRPVVGALQQLDNLAGVVGRVLHRRALCAEERRRRLYQRPIHLVAHVQRQQLREDRLGGGLENVVDRPRPPWTALARPGRGDGEDGEGGGRRGDRALEPREHDFDRVEGPRLELRHQRFHQFGGVGGARFVTDVDPLRRHRPLRELEERDALLAHDVQLHGDTLALQLLDAVPRLAGQLGVERTAQPAVRRDQEQGHPLAARSPIPRLAQQCEPPGELGGVEIADEFGQRSSVRARCDPTVLRALELRRSDELHRLGDLARALDGLDPPAQFAGLRHQRAIFLYSSIAALSRAASAAGGRLGVPIAGALGGWWAFMG